MLLIRERVFRAQGKLTACLFRFEHFRFVFSTAVLETVVFIQPVRGEQKLQTADFRSVGSVPPPHSPPPPQSQDVSRLKIIAGRCTPPP